MEASERFGVRWTGSHDFDESGVPDAVTRGRRHRAGRVPGDAGAADRQERPARRLARRRRRRPQAVRVARLHVLPSARTAAEVDDLHRSGALRHGRHLARGRGEEGRRDRSLPICVGPRPAEERQGRNPHSAVQRSQAPSDRRQRGQRARQRAAGAALRRTRRVPDAAAVGRRLDRALRPPRRFPHARRDHRRAWRRGPFRARRLSRARQVPTRHA